MAQATPMPIAAPARITWRPFSGAKSQATCRSRCQTKYELVISVVTAKALGLDVAAKVLGRRGDRMTGGTKARIAAFRWGLERRGWLEGRNVHLDYNTGELRNHSGRPQKTCIGGQEAGRGSE